MAWKSLEQNRNLWAPTEFVNDGWWPTAIVWKATTDQSASPNAQRALVVAVARAHAWLDALEDHRYANVAALAEVVGFDPSYVRRILNLTLLSPAMVERVFNSAEADEDALGQLALGRAWCGTRQQLPVESGGLTQ